MKKSKIKPVSRKFTFQITNIYNNLKCKQIVNIVKKTNAAQAVGKGLSRVAFRHYFTYLFGDYPVESRRGDRCLF